MQQSFWWVRWLAPVLGLVAVVYCLRDLNFLEFGMGVRTLGAWVALLFIPSLLALACESWGWQMALRGVGSEASWRSLFLVRGSTEALSVFFPGGALFGESAKPMLLHKWAGIPWSMGVAATAYRKFLRVFAHGIFLIGIALLCGTAIDRWSTESIGRGGGAALLAGVGLVLAASSLGSFFLLRSGSCAERVHGWSRARLPLSWRPRVDSWRDGFLATDESTRRFFSLELHLMIVPLSMCLLAWFFESLEAFVLLCLLGQIVPLDAVFAVDVGVSLLRQLLVLLPGGVGVQELGYASGLLGLGLSDPVFVSGAFILLKRGRELLQSALFLLVFLPGRGIEDVGVGRRAVLPSFGSFRL